MYGVILLAVFAQAPIRPTLPNDSAVAFKRAARRAESEYERLQVRLVPYRLAGSSGPCDEVVGRFCLHYDQPSEKDRAIEPEDPRTIAARRLAVEASRRAFAALPADITIARPLVRFLVEDERAAEGVATARTFAWASRDSIWGPLLLGFALHANAQDSLAEAEFDRAVRFLDAGETRRALRVEKLLAPSERGVYSKLGDIDRAAYERWFWRVADALYATPGNETRAEHLARYVWATMFAEAALPSLLSWGYDLEELEMRYGVPRARYRESVGALGETRLIERYDPNEVSLTPYTLGTKGLLRTPAPGDSSELNDSRARTGYAPATVRRLVSLIHQVTRFPAGDSVILRVDAQLVMDSIARGAEQVEAFLFVTDSLAPPRRIGATTARAVKDTARFTLHGKSTWSALLYSAEAIESKTRLAGRARYATELTTLARKATTLSDILIAYPLRGETPRSGDDPVLRGRANLVVSKSDTLGVYAEIRTAVAQRDSFPHNVELTLRRVGGPSPGESALNVLGKLLGRRPGQRGGKMSWHAQGSPGQVSVVAVDISVATLKTGLYELVLSVSPAGSAQAVSTTRRLRITD
jgi:hypothetical protein